MNIREVLINSDKYNFSVQIAHPNPWHITGLRTLWKEAFGDEDTFLDTFFSTAFAPERCLCILHEENVISALYWFECEYLNQPLAYIYAVTTAKTYRGMGLCRQLLTAVHATLKQQGYIGTLLVPGSESLFDFYKKAGYKTTCYRHMYQYNLNIQSDHASVLKQTHPDTVSLSAASVSPIKQLSAAEYATLRKNFLPSDSILQEKENLAFLQTQLNFYSGEDFLMAVRITDQRIYCPEFLYTKRYTSSDTSSDTSSKNSLSETPCIHSLINKVLSYFNCTGGVFCTPGVTSPFAMYYSLNTHSFQEPAYFAFAYD